jgi:hypothetical protein
LHIYLKSEKIKTTQNQTINNAKELTYIYVKGLECATFDAYQYPPTFILSWFLAKYESLGHLFCTTGGKVCWYPLTFRLDV